jgi:hypothetical protein
MGQLFTAMALGGCANIAGEKAVTASQATLSRSTDLERTDPRRLKFITASLHSVSGVWHVCISPYRRARDFQQFSGVLVWLHPLAR